MDEKILQCLNELIALDLACAAAYEVARGVSRDEEIQGTFSAFREDHLRHVAELGEHVRRAGIEPPRELDTKGEIIRAFTTLASQEDRTAVLVMRGNEELSNNAYASALRAGLPEEIRARVAANFEDARQHMSWMRGTVLLRGWDVEQPEIRELSAEARGARKAA
ncbi:ferritin-like domain-containing protein [Polyangium mundeleinium]|uniref:Ferritin-like domain-containing protein n=1 Tax=Polyangium mundeleinium TaxID=2995306 RepID=A0ABT5EYZ5_9BACT|nr:ferritin-like domain-containing protein [Polyangium mundeleinium]MDC0746497.1 ferritin-like domain-containing protein [Polyangium mundeleinium]